MPEIAEVEVDGRNAYLLDASIFVFDILNLEKLIKKASNNEVILEVPSAFVTMIRSSMSGDPLLQNLIYAYVRGMQQSGLMARNKNVDINRLTNATEEELRSFSEISYTRILSYYSLIIEGATKGDGDLRPIKRYEPILIGQTSGDISKMRDSYSTEFGIPPHPLIDLYFLQIHHAQSVGIAESPLLPRIFTFLGSQATGALSRWVGVTNPNTLTLNTRERYRRHLAWFIKEFIADEFFDTAVQGALGLGVSFVFTGTLGITVISGVSVANLVYKVAVGSTVKSPWLIKETDVPFVLIIIFGSLVICICLVTLIPSIRANFLGSKQPTPTLSLFPTPEATQTLLSVPPVVPSITALAPFDTATPTLITIPTVPVSTSSSFDSGYCMYVIQPNDTLQSISSRFQVTENEIKSNNKLVAWGAFSVNQMILVNAPCCRPANINGYTYTVQQGETLYSIAGNNAISVSQLATVNNLFDSSYIQSGQMLCVPYP